MQQGHGFPFGTMLNVLLNQISADCLHRNNRNLHLIRRRCGEIKKGKWQYSSNGWAFYIRLMDSAITLSHTDGDWLRMKQQYHVMHRSDVSERLPVFGVGHRRHGWWM